jgi:hypothetical protein
MATFDINNSFNGRTVRMVEVEDYGETSKVVAVYFTDETKMRIEIKAVGSNYEFDEVTVNIFEL